MNIPGQTFSKSLNLIFIIGTIFLSIMSISLTFADDYVQDFEVDPKDWSSVDEPAELMGDPSPGIWRVRKSPFLDGSELHQSSNAWGDKTDVWPLGTYYIYDGDEYDDFILEADAYAGDNDGFGFLFRYIDRKNHYRFLTMVDSNNPANALPKDKGPWSRFDVRLGEKGDELPYYELLGRKPDTYQQNKRQHLRLELEGNKFTAFLEDEEVVSATDANNTYTKGKIGFVCYVL